MHNTNWCLIGDREERSSVKKSIENGKFRTAKEIGTAVIQKKSLDKDDAVFWLYVALREEMLPLSYYNNMMEAAMVMGDVFNWLF